MIGTTRGIPSDVLHDRAFALMRAQENLGNIVKILKKCHGLVKKFQRGDDDTLFPLEEHEKLSCIQGTHLLIFDQCADGKTQTRTFLCKRVNGNLSVLKDVYYSSFNETFSPLLRYEYSLIHAASCLLRKSYRGSLFPVCVVSWLSSSLVCTESIVFSMLSDPTDIWLLHKEEDHWTTKAIYDALFKDGIRYNSMLTCISVNCSVLATKIGLGQKRPRSKFRIVNEDTNSLGDCLNFVDCIKSADDKSLCEFDWDHDSLLKLLKDVNPISYANDYVKFVKIKSFYDAMASTNSNLKFVDQPSPINMIKTCSCCNDSVKNTVHICGELSIDDDMPTFASLAFEKEFNLVSCEDDYISTNDMTLSKAGGKFFFYQIVSTKEGKSGKDMSALKTNALRELTEAMDSFKERCDIHRPGSDIVRANRIRMYMS